MHLCVSSCAPSCSYSRTYITTRAPAAFLSLLSCISMLMFAYSFTCMHGLFQYALSWPCVAHLYCMAANEPPTCFLPRLAFPLLPFRSPPVIRFPLHPSPTPPPSFPSPLPPPLSNLPPPPPVPAPCPKHEALIPFWLFDHAFSPCAHPIHVILPACPYSRHLPSLSPPPGPLPCHEVQHPSPRALLRPRGARPPALGGHGEEEARAQLLPALPADGGVRVLDVRQRQS